jgi:uncharacterized protein (TIGR02598 family)
MRTAPYMHEAPEESPSQPRSGTQALRALGSPSHGFSLIEVTIALGIVSFALIALFGLLPTGLTTFRSSIDRSVASQIAQNIINQARQTEFSSLSTLATPAGSPKRFTEDGDETTDATKTIYVAKIEVETSVSLPADLPTTNTSMAKIRVRVVNSPSGSEAAFTSNSTSSVVQDFSAFIPKM